MRKELKVSTVTEGSQADQLGIQSGDILVSYNGTAVYSNLDLSNAVFNAKNKKIENLELVILRNGSEVRLRATLEPLGITCMEEGREPAANTKNRVNYKTDYGVARGVCSLVSFLGWLLVFGGVIVALTAIGGSSRYGSVSLIAMLPGLGTAVSGFMMIMGSQVTRATVDNADHTREILATINRD